MSDVEKCCAGCMVFTGGEIRHIKECVFYPESLTERYDKLEARNTQLINLIERVLPYLETNKGDCLLDNSIIIEAKKLLRNNN